MAQCDVKAKIDCNGLVIVKLRFISETMRNSLNRNILVI